MMTIKNGIFGFLLVVMVFSLTACYAYELKLEDPIFDFRQQGLKRVLILPFEKEMNLSEQGQTLANKTHELFKRNLKDIKSIEIVEPDALTEWPTPLWDLSSSFVQKIGKSAQVDLIITGRLKLRTASPLFFKDSTLGQGANLFLDSELVVQFWDTQQGGMVLFQQTSYQVNGASDTNLLVETASRQLALQITRGIKPYYVYK